eukprot:TRINITY_DN71052_c0_g1_i1.p1 TRINITY_DN71052_c0_g1~~TRINITY_DN71052_c0_g1_i1.p1  ORF type:complete len:360 (-),score=35.98 TRINITY_DN71052_c0_g1_i1:84-1163(-)
MDFAWILCLIMHVPLGCTLLRECKDEGHKSGDPLCEVDGRDYLSCCVHENISCWVKPRRLLAGPTEFYSQRCCEDSLATSELAYDEMLPRGRVLNMVLQGTPGVVIVRGVPGLAALLRRSFPVWYCVSSWPNRTGAITQRAVPEVHRAIQRKDRELVTILGRLARWIVSALAKDLREKGHGKASDVLEGIFNNTPIAHVRHFEYLHARWRREDGWMDRARWADFFAMHSDAFWISLQTAPTLAGKGFCDGTFLVDQKGYMHRVRLKQGDVAIWFGDAVNKLTAGMVRAAKHMVTVHRSYAERLLKDGPRRVTMFHVYPTSRNMEDLRKVADVDSEPKSRWTLHAQLLETRHKLSADYRM